MKRPEASGGVLEGVRGVLFDLDGTLIDSVGLITASFRHATAEVLGEELGDEVILRNVGMPLRAQMVEIAPDHADELLASYRAHNAAFHDAMVSAFPGAAEVVATLRSRGYRLGVVTSKSEAMMLRGLAHCGLAGSFDALVSAEDVAEHKPRPAPVLEGARRIGVPADECAYLGDSPHDVAAALAAGAVALAAEWGAFAPGVLEAAGPARSLAAIEEVLELLLGMSPMPAFAGARHGVQTDRPTVGQ